MPLSELTTLRVGGPARRIARADSAEEAVEVVSGADAAGEPVLVIAGGSNLLIADRGFDGHRAAGCGGGVAGSDGATTACASTWAWGALGRRRRLLRDPRARRRRVPVGDPGLGRRHADTERRRLRAGGRRTIVSVRAYDRRTARSRAEPQPCGFALPVERVQARGAGRAGRCRSCSSAARWRCRSLRRAGARMGVAAQEPPRRWARCAKPCWGCGAARGWCSTRGTPTRFTAGSFFTTRSSPPRRSPRSGGRAGGGPVPGAGRAGQDVGGVAHRARRVSPRLRRWACRDLQQAHARDHQPRRREQRRAGGARARDARRRARRVRGGAGSGADPGRDRALKCRDPSSADAGSSPAVLAGEERRPLADGARKQQHFCSACKRRPRPAAAPRSRRACRSPPSGSSWARSPCAPSLHGSSSVS